MTKLQRENVGLKRDIETLVDSNKINVERVVTLQREKAKIKEALQMADASLTTIRNAPGNTLNPHVISREAYEAHELVKAALLLLQ